MTERLKGGERDLQQQRHTKAESMGRWIDEQRNVTNKYNWESKLKQTEKKKKQNLCVISQEVVWGVF